MNNFNKQTNSYAQDKYELIQKQYREFQHELNSSGLLNFSTTFLADFPLDTLPSQVIEFINENNNIRKTIEKLNANLGKRIENLGRSLFNNSTFEGLPVATQKINFKEIYYDIDRAMQKVNKAIKFVNDNLQVLQKISKENKHLNQKTKDLENQVNSMSRELSHQQFKIDQLYEDNLSKEKELQSSFTSWLNNSQKLDMLERLMTEQEIVNQDAEYERNQLITMLEKKIKKLADAQKIEKTTYESIKTRDITNQDFYIGIVDLLHYFTFRYVSDILGNASLLEKFCNNHLSIVKNLLDEVISKNENYSDISSDLFSKIENAKEDSLLIPNNSDIEEILVIKNTNDLKDYLENSFSKKITKDQIKLDELISIFENIKSFINSSEHEFEQVDKNIKSIDEILNNFVNVLQQYQDNVSKSIGLLNSQSDELKFEDELLKEKYWSKSNSIIEKIYKLISDWFFDFKRIDDYLKCINNVENENDDKAIYIDNLTFENEDNKFIDIKNDDPINEKNINDDLIKVSEEIKDVLVEDLIEQENYSDELNEFIIEPKQIENIESYDASNIEINDPKIEAIRRYIDKIVYASNQSIIDKINRLEDFLKLNPTNLDKKYSSNDEDKLLKENHEKKILMHLNSNKNLKLRLIKSKLTRLKIETEISRNQIYKDVLDQLV